MDDRRANFVSAYAKKYKPIVPFPWLIPLQNAPFKIKNDYKINKTHCIIAIFRYEDFLYL